MAKIRKLSALVVVGALALTAAGCASTQGGDSSEGGSLTYWSMWKEGEAQQKVLASAIDDFQKETGITVDVQWQGRDNTKKVVPTLNTNKVPDLIDGSFAKLAPVLAESGQAKALADAYAADVDGEKAADLIPKAYLAGDILTRKGDDAPWMLPYSLTSDAVWFNAATHPDLVSAPPADWDAFIAELDKLKAANEVPIAIDGDVAGYNAYWYTAAIVHIAGPGALLEIASDKSGKAWDEPEALEAAEMVQQLVDGGYFISGYNASKWPAQQQAWADNKAALMFNGTWIPTETGPYAADGFEYSSFPFPTVDGGEKVARADFVGFSVPARAKNAENAQKFATFFLQKKYQDALGTDAKILPVRQDAATSPEMETVKAALDSADAFYQQNDGISFPGYTEKLLWPAINDLVLGKVTAKEFVATMESGQADYWKQNS
ncbi:carbohydrate ABC transporter substrate-binding protein [Microbacterium bovistercoris]|uniref:Carbohydrate ABC transporter substrate-binding protein n=1 Tax=Microbacterium bovistercoris TaxID=2293570 RepID=A0A371NY06_9MICO|nr:ABC transporter substrate-binding protein [Microbacterium bovistercoris]REJ08350.1 carbohydrate ABC transporter substrate-binding protein [Microbacterium bovistercoris]